MFLHVMSTRSNAAAVIDLEAFRQKKMMREERAQESASSPRDAAVLVPVWFCWVPVWTPMM
jgi:hypothetical protein